MPLGPNERNPQSVAEDIMEAADQDISTDDLTRGTEVYEEIDDDVDGQDGDPEELSFEPEEESYSGSAFDDDAPEAESGDYDEYY